MAVNNRIGSGLSCTTGPAAGVETAPGTATIVVRLDGSVIGTARFDNSGLSDAAQLRTRRIRLEPEPAGGPVLLEPGQATSHTLSASASDNCGTGGGMSSAHFTIHSVAIDVIGVK
jgi:hypothetical protein